MQGGFDVLETQFKNQNMKMEIQRKLPDGSYAPANSNEVDHLKTQARMSTFAGAIKDMTVEEKTACAIEMKKAANQLYEEEDYEEAMQVYMQVLMAANFGSGLKNLQENYDDIGENNDNIPRVEELPDDYDAVEVEENEKAKASDTNNVKECDENNIDSLVVPVLNNLTACCIQLGFYGKAIQFATQTLSLRPNTPRAILRLGRAHLELANFREAEKYLNQALNSSYTSEADKGRAKIFLERVVRGLHREQSSLRRRKQAMKKAFHVDKNMSSTISSLHDEQKVEDNEEKMGQCWTMGNWLPKWLNDYRYELIMCIAFVCIIVKVVVLARTGKKKILKPWQDEDLHQEMKIRLEQDL
jgi:tetratricopeptide (TPR) repeat protein